MIRNMSKGLGELQRDIKRILELLSRNGCNGAQFQLIAYFFLLQDYDAKDLKRPRQYREEDTGGDLVLTPQYRRSMQRALTSLQKRGEVIVVKGYGGRRGARYYALAKPAEPPPNRELSSEEERAILLKHREQLWQKILERDRAGLLSNLG